METLRLFVSVQPPSDALAHLAEQVARLEVSRANAPGRSTRVAPPDRWHVTLAFLGEVPAERADAAGAAVRSAVATWSGGPIGVAIAGGGTFGRGPRTTLWAGLTGDLPALRALAAEVRRALRRARLRYDDKPLRPHLTLARPGTRLAPDLVEADVATLAAYAGPSWPVTAVHLVRSDLGPAPVHTPLVTAVVP
jgi:2'-5' RNA ligase